MTKLVQLEQDKWINKFDEAMKAHRSHTGAGEFPEHHRLEYWPELI